ncbi:hypothetical protein AALP_AA2G103000 [Arabis alpina]|uniref:Pollen Ole e 1 allergen and extensin family protein n=1 Tax=Arabis alpina TaxID=50452 RepID=A0A087HGI0_ARAAL|nr:hypothetical protein AALP_AA2G103000 [Arabis alpina]
MKTSHSAFFITILLISSFSLPTHGLILNGLRIGSIKINGVLYCSFDGNLHGNSPPLSGAVVELVCAGARTDLGQVVTNPAGVFVILVKLLDTVLFDPSICFARLNLPIATCAVIPPDGALTASLILANIVQTVLGNIANFTVTPFVNSVL